MANLEERLDAVERMIKMPSFRENKGLGNEVGYYVFDYPANQELIVRERIQYMKAKNSKGTDGFELVVFDLYDIIIDLLEQEDFLEQCFQFEKKKGMERIVKAVGNLLQVNDEESLIVKHIQEHTPQDAVVFIVEPRRIEERIKSLEEQLRVRLSDLLLAGEVLYSHEEIIYNYEDYL